MVVLPFRGSLLAWGNGQRRVSWRSQREMVILHLWRNNPMHQYRLGTGGMESSFEEKIHESWPWSNNVSLEQRNLKAALWIGPAAAWGRGSSPSTQTQWDASGGMCPVLGYPVPKRHGLTRVRTLQLHEDDWNICLTKRGWELEQFSTKKRRLEGDLTTMWKYLSEGGQRRPIEGILSGITWKDKR